MATSWIGARIREFFSEDRYLLKNLSSDIDYEAPREKSLLHSPDATVTKYT